MNEEEFRYISELTSDYTFCSRVTPDGHMEVEWITGAFERISGFSFDELPDRDRIFSLVHPDDRHIARERQSKVLQGERWAGEFRILRKDGQVVWLRSQVQPVIDDAGRVTRIYGAAQDITERMHAERAVQESEERFRGTFENAAVGITHTDMKRRILRINQKFCEIVGYSEEELLGRDTFEITFEQDRVTPPEFAALHRGEADHASMEKRYIRKDGHQVWVKITSSLQHDHEGFLLYCISIVEDISSRKRAEMRLAAEHAVSQVLGTARSLSEAAPWVLESLCESLNVDIGELWLPEDGGSSVYCAAVHTSDGLEDAGEWRGLASTVRFQPGEGLPGMVWESRSPMWLLDILEGPPSPRKELAHRLGMSSNMAFPLLAGNECMGVICLYARRKLVTDDLLQKALSTLGRDIGLFAQRERVEMERERLSASVESSNDFIAVAALDGECIYVNRAGQRLVGLDSHGDARRLIEDYLFPEDLPFVRNTVLPKVLSDGRWTGEFRFRHFRTGEPIEVLWDIFLIRDPATSEPVNFATVTRDITEVKQAEKALRESENQFRGTFENAAVGVAHVGLDGEWLRVNQNLCDILGHSREELLQKTFQQITHPDDLHVDDIQRRQLESGEVESYRVEKRYIRGDGSIVWVRLYASLQRNEKGHPVYHISVIEDITELVEAERLLTEANQELELRIKNRTADLEKLTERLRLLASELVETEQRERRHLAEIIHDHLQQLLVAAKMHVNAAHLHAMGTHDSEPLGVAVSLLDQAINESRSLTAQLRPPALYESGLISALRWLRTWMEQAHGLKVELDLEPQAEPDLERGAVLLFESVRELLLNVVKYAEVDEARVRLIKVDADRLCLTVEDNGRGFDPAVLDGPPKNTGGFGLFSIQERMRAMGGECEVRSAPGRGTVVQLRAPLYDPVAASPEHGGVASPVSSALPVPASERMPAVGEIGIVIADDHSIVREGIARIIGSAPDMLVVREVADGRAALKAARELRPDVVVMDVNMPEMNGIDATRAICETVAGVQIIGLSVHTDEATQQAMLEAGARAYLAKDGPAETLLSSIRQLAGRGEINVGT